MKTKARLLAPLLVIAMVLSLLAGAITISPPQAVLAGEAPVLTVDITAPAMNTTMSCCQYFYVNFAIHNDGPGTAYEINVEASVDANASIFSTNPLIYPQLKEGWNILGAFNLHCDSVGTSNITVKVTWQDELGNSYGPVSDTVAVEQQNPAELKVEITEPANGTQFTACQNFEVTARVSNPAPSPGADVDGVEATIDIVGNASLEPPPPTQPETQTIGTIP